MGFLDFVPPEAGFLPVAAIVPKQHAAAALLAPDEQPHGFLKFVTPFADEDDAKGFLEFVHPPAAQQEQQGAEPAPTPLGVVEFVDPGEPGSPTFRATSPPSLAHGQHAPLGFVEMISPFDDDPVKGFLQYVHKDPSDELSQQEESRELVNSI